MIVLNRSKYERTFTKTPNHFCLLKSLFYNTLVHTTEDAKSGQELTVCMQVLIGILRLPNYFDDSMHHRCFLHTLHLICWPTMANDYKPFNIVDERHEKACLRGCALFSNYLCLI